MPARIVPSRRSIDGQRPLLGNKPPATPAGPSLTGARPLKGNARFLNGCSSARAACKHGPSSFFVALKRRFFIAVPVFAFSRYSIRDGERNHLVFPRTSEHFRGDASIARAPADLAPRTCDRTPGAE